MCIPQLPMLFISLTSAILSSDFCCVLVVLFY